MSKIRKANVEEPLTGDDLLQRVQELSGLDKTEKAKACGYVTQAPKGKERVQLSQFLNALIEAQDIQVDILETPKRGRSLSYRASVQQNGNILISAGYTKEMNLNPGDRFEITLGRTNIKLTALDDEFDDDVID